MAKKKKKPTKKPRARKNAHIDFECISGACTPSEQRARIGPRNNVVILSAIGTSVTLKFNVLTGSPFKGRRRTLSIGAGKSKHIQVDSRASNGSYPYDLVCSACRGVAPPASPVMIVP